MTNILKFNKRLLKKEKYYYQITNLLIIPPNFLK